MRKTTVPVLRHVSVEYEVMVVSDDDYEAREIALRAIEGDNAGDPIWNISNIVDDEGQIPHDWRDSIPFGDIPPEWDLGTDPTCLEIYDKLRELKIIQYHDPNQMKLPGFENIKP
jgi:hypothetical protein